MENKQTHIFGLGTGRCGTVTLVRQLGLLPGSIAVHEGVCFTRGLPLKMAHLFHGRVEDPASIQWNRWALQTRRAIAGRARSFYVEAAGYLSLNIPLILEVGFRPKIIHLVRKPLATITSFIRKNGAVLPVYQAATHPAGGAKWASWYDAFPPYPGCASGEEGLARYWNEVNSEIEKQCGVHGLSRLVVHLERMKELETWQTILQFCGLPWVIQKTYGAMNVSSDANQKFVDEVKIKAAVEAFCTWSIPEHLSVTGPA